MRKDNEERLRRIHGSSEALSVRIQNIKKGGEDKSSNSSHGEDEAYEEDVGGSRNERYRDSRNHRRYEVRKREEWNEGV